MPDSLPTPTADRQVALCVTCLVDQVMPEVGLATVKLLRRAGFRVEFPAGQTCCGQPFFNSGFRTQAARLARRTIEIFEPYPAVVLPSGSCATMIRVEYPHLLADEPAWHERAERLAAKTYELSQILVQVAGWPPPAAVEDPTEPATSLAEPAAVTYHDSCHMCRLLGLRQEPRQLLTQAGYSLHEMNEPDRCCGFGGLFSVRMAEVSNAMTAEKLRQAAGTGAEALVTADPGCLMQMRGLAGPDGLPVRHLAVVLEEATR
ncbi:MAG: (Fe-S)-binding protein [Chloroflexi bacterium]|nr:(Fe-S)-binding protein [Chloroflexota bacterium]MCI0577016.1 (Fe-S)-binding protein [Chloroflexota bacterium]MCI0648828.1 (Fe-S)-binding protein [Chloroflexota bacterium]MCI0726330.1 (Fe-S)-binding protein [Chloroflexota bacterium]